MACKNTQGKRNMFGNLQTQKWAQEALPLLVKHVHEHKTISFKELAAYFNRKAFQIFGSVCGIISTTLYELERRPDWKFGEIPRITNIVVRSDGTPAGFVRSKITGDKNIVPSLDEFHDQHLLPTFEYQHWNDVLNALNLPSLDDVKTQPIDFDQIHWNPEQLLSDFLSAAEHGQIEIPPDSIVIESLPKPHIPPKSLPEEKMAVYVFSTDTEILKVGKANIGSKDRYLYQHYNPNAAGSTLAKSLMEDENIPSLFRPKKETISELIKEKTDRVNFLIDEHLGPFVLNLFEAFVQCRLKPKYEGFKSQR